MVNSSKRLINIPVPMRDGVLLSADIYLPITQGPFPTILVRTCYVKSEMSSHMFVIEDVRKYTENGFAYVIQDVRGRGDSDGKWYPYFNEATDGYDSVEWVANQSWCNGNVGMWGSSYLALTSFMAATLNPPHLRAIFISGVPGIFLESGSFCVNNILNLPAFFWLVMTNGRTNQMSSSDYVGITKTSFNVPDIAKSLPLYELDKNSGMLIPFWQDASHNLRKTEFWKPVDFDEAYQNINIPIFFETGWYDSCAWGTLYHFRKMIEDSPAKTDQYLMVGPWDHMNLRVVSSTRYYGQECGESSKIDLYQKRLDFFNHYLEKKGTFSQLESRFQLFIMGKNKWVAIPNPVKWFQNDDNQFIFYLGSSIRANSLDGDGFLRPVNSSVTGYDQIIYDPAKPTPISPELEDGWRSDDWFSDENSTYDLAPIQRRPDVLVFTSQIINSDLIISGFPVLDFWASSDCHDTDFIVSFCSVTPEGKTVQLGGITSAIRARYRNSLIHEELLEPNKIYNFKVKLTPITYGIPKDHRIRIDIRSSYHPFYARNLNTGEDPAFGFDMRIATNRIYHTQKYPSKLILPLLKESLTK